MKNTFVIFVWNEMNIGGIETYIYETVSNNRIAIKFGLIKEENTFIHPSFIKGLKENLDYIENGLRIRTLKEFIKNNNVSNVKVITFSLKDFARMESIKKQIQKYPIDTFLFIPHFKGTSIYLEDEMINNLRKILLEKITKKIYFKLISNSNLYFFADGHRIELKKRYGIDAKKNLMIPKNENNNLVFDAKRVENVYFRDDFNILIISRMDFPHKGFMVGAVKAFLRLKKRYKNIMLTIVGDGEGKIELEKILKFGNKEHVKSINMVGYVAPEELNKYYDDANLLISVSGCLSRGAKRGVLSLAARHYDYECEVYGFLPQAFAFRLSDKPGEPVDQYIEQAINMEYDEYFKLCKSTFDIYQDENKKNANNNSFQNIKNNTRNMTLNSWDKIIIYSRRITQVFHEKGFLWIVKKIQNIIRQK